MCLIAIRIASGARWPLVIAANRDEAHARPSDPAGWWPDGPPAILAGRDRLAGGSWLGLARPGLPHATADGGIRLRIAALTNVRPGLMPTVAAGAAGGTTGLAEARPPPEPVPSRGQLVTGWLRAAPAVGPLDWLHSVSEERDRYAGFNLVAIDAEASAGRIDCRAALLSNAGPEPARAAGDGLIVVSNGPPGAWWPKTRRLAAVLDTVPDDADDDADGDRILAHLLAGLADRREAAPGEQPPTGLAPERERAQSAVFIADPHYGTRASTVILVRADGEVQFVEQGFGPEGRPIGRVRERFRMPIGG